ncbi:MAG: alpha/beta hydrolase family protein, partial [Acidobacteriota bacterium]
PQSRNLGFGINTPRTPGDVYSMDLTGGNLTRWTESETGGLVAGSFTLPALIRFPTFDEVDGKPRLIPAFYYRPRGDGPFPVLIQIHGGPEGQARPFFNPIFQYWVNELGLAVLVPNVRGSSGYGKAYRELDNGRRREDSVRDIGALLDWVRLQPELDAGRMGVIGGSYGGYMSLACMVRFNQQLRAGVDVVGISNFVTFLENTKAYRRDLRRVEYGDERIPEMREYLNRISPAIQAERIMSPLLIVSGQNDPRVPASEGAQMADVIRANGGTVWTVLATDEGHGFRKKRNRDFYNSVVSVFLEKYLIHSQAANAVGEGQGTGR